MLSQNDMQKHFTKLTASDLQHKISREKKIKGGRKQFSGKP